VLLCGKSAHIMWKLVNCRSTLQGHDSAAGDRVRSLNQALTPPGQSITSPHLAAFACMCTFAHARSVGDVCHTHSMSYSMSHTLYVIRLSGQISQWARKTPTASMKHCQEHIQTLTYTHSTQTITHPGMHNHCRGSRCLINYTGITFLTLYLKFNIKFQCSATHLQPGGFRCMHTQRRVFGDHPTHPIGDSPDHHRFGGVPAMHTNEEEQENVFWWGVEQ
jgi:hypothetical protein